MLAGLLLVNMFYNWFVVPRISLSHSDLAIS
jgi:hypothetical protein